MLTGYWPPTNEMVRRFSTNPSKNPEGWIGKNWEDRGFNIHSFFPEFEDYPKDKVGNGDFEVLYQDTSRDFWRITSEIRPVAIITCSQTPSKLWEIEAVQYNWKWVWNRDISGQSPNPDPPDDSLPPDAPRYSTLPMEEIKKAVNDANLSIKAAINSSGVGKYLSEYIAYHGTWYRDLHFRPNSNRQCVAAGHIHVSREMPLDEAITATEITLRVVIDHISQLLPPFRIMPDVRELKLKAALPLLAKAGIKPDIQGPQDSDAWVWKQNPFAGSVVQSPFKALLRTQGGPVL